MPAAEVADGIPMVRALRMTFGAGRKFWPLAVWFFFTYGSIMVYQGLWAGPFFQDILGWDRSDCGTVLTFIGLGMILGCPTAGYISDKILQSRRKVLITGTIVYTFIWAIIWITSGQISSVQAYMAINFAFGFFGGFLPELMAAHADMHDNSHAGCPHFQREGSIISFGDGRAIIQMKETCPYPGSASRLLPAQQLRYCPLALLRRPPGIDLIASGAGQKLTEELGAKPPLEIVFHQQMGIEVVIFLQKGKGFA